MPPAAFHPSARRLSRASLGLAFSLLLASCGGAAGFTPLASGAEPPASCARPDADNVISLSAKDIKFSAPCIVAPADTPFTIRFTNEESMPHDVALWADASTKSAYFKGDVIIGPNKSIDYSIDPIPAGEHYFDCTVHPEQMNGALYVR
jgi:plastocyanin